jgi:hypothetical protein
LCLTQISTPGKALEVKLNTEYGPGTPIYEDLCKYVREGLEEGWVANVEVDGKKYRRSKVCLPSPENRYFSITTVYMDSEEEYSGQYHVHPYGEINCVVQLDEKAELKGMQGWQGAGWTSPVREHSTSDSIPEKVIANYPLTFRVPGHIIFLKVCSTFLLLRECLKKSSS